MSQLQPPANVTMFLRCGQIGNRLCPEPWVGQTGGGRSAGLPLPGVGVQLAGRLPRCRRQAGRRACSATRRSSRRPSPYPLTYRLDFLATAGTLVLFATFIALIPMLAAGAKPGILGVAFRKTVGAAAAADRHDRVHPLDRDGDELFRA